MCHCAVWTSAGTFCSFNQSLLLQKKPFQIINMTILIFFYVAKHLRVFDQEVIIEYSSLYFCTYQVYGTELIICSQCNYTSFQEDHKNYC